MSKHGKLIVKVPPSQRRQNRAMQKHLKQARKKLPSFIKRWGEDEGAKKWMAKYFGYDFAEQEEE